VAGVAQGGGRWRVGTDAEIAWIVDGTSVGLTITAAVPPVFEAYATVVLPSDSDGRDRHDQAVLALLRGAPAGQPWWLGFLRTGSADTVFPAAPTVTLYSGWHYVLVEAGPEQAAAWRRPGPWASWEAALPDLMFPADQSWLVSKLWDDDWCCIGGPAALVSEFLHHPDLVARAVELGQDATPPGHEAH
jgi:hypothetical protein